MSAQTALLAGRAAAEAMMLDACTITRAGTGGPVFDPDTGEYTEPTPTTVYSGACKVQARTSVSTSAVGGELLTMMQVEVHVPMSVTGVQVNDVVTITASVNDAALVDRGYRVTDDPAKSFATARRLRCEEVQ